VYKKGEEKIFKGINYKNYTFFWRCFLRVYKIPHLRWLFLLNVVIKGGMQPFGGYKMKFLENTTLKGGFHQFYHQKN